MGLVMDAVLVTLIFITIGAVFIFIMNPITESTGEDLSLSDYFIDGLQKVFVDFGVWIRCALNLGCPTDCGDGTCSTTEWLFNLCPLDCD